MVMVSPFLSFNIRDSSSFSDVIGMQSGVRFCTGSHGVFESLLLFEGVRFMSPRSSLLK